MAGMRRELPLGLLLLLLFLGTAFGLECYNGTQLVECEEKEACWSRGSLEYGCGTCSEIDCSVCTTDQCNVPETELSTTWRWLVLFLFFFLALILGLVVLIHFKKNGCKTGRERSTVNDLGRENNRKDRRISVNDRDINQWKDLEEDVS
ncbi:hypothetical protein ACHWQZ_G012532 [Mnemiopsis leidyi]